MNFRLLTILWAFALLASAMALVGPWGMLLAAVVMGYWVKHAVAPEWRLSVTDVLVSVAILCLVVALAIPASYLLPSDRREWCREQLQHMANAVRHHRLRNGELPRDFSTAGGVKLTWRIKIWPDLGYQDLVNELGLDENWNAANKNALIGEELYETRCPSHCINCKPCAYFAVKGEETYWMENSSPFRKHQSDYACDTVMLIEANPERGEWYEAHDLTLEEALELLTSDSEGRKLDGHNVFEGLFYKRGITRNVAMADGSVRTLYPPLPHDLARAILTDRQDEMDRRRLDRYSRPQIHYERIYATVCFVLLSLAPLKRVKRNSETDESDSGVP